MLNVAVFASGQGSNFKAILDAIRTGTIRNARVVLLISNNSGAGALMIAREHQIPAAHISRKQFGSDEAYTAALYQALKSHDANFIALAGYMKLIPREVVRAFRNRILNIHPALLPRFGGAGMYGLRVHEAVLASGSKVSGATVHLVDEEYDRGPVVMQETLDVADSDTPETLASRVLEIEHRLYPRVLELFAEGRVKIDGGHVTISNSE